MNNLSPHLFEQQFLHLLRRKGGSINEPVQAMLTRLVRATISQHSCIDLAAEPPTLVDQLHQTGIVGDEKATTPFIMHDNKLYLARFFHYEKQVARLVSARNVIQQPPDETLAAQLDAHFGSEPGNRQKLAALLAVTRRLAIITGGPGTGKTSTVVRILEILLAANPDLVVRLAAPTGKATMRLAASLSDWAGETDRQPGIQTLHRLLGMRRDSRSFRHGPDNPVKADVLIIDEASMIDLVMMMRVLRSLSDHTRLILLGDPDQLPSVDTGNVLADLCAGDPGFSPAFRQAVEPLVGQLPPADQVHGLTDAVCRLQQTYRFKPGSSIAALAGSVRRGKLPARGQDTGVAYRPAYDGSDPAALLAYFDDYLTRCRNPDPDIHQLLETFEQVRILCSRRGGDNGVTRINQDIERALEARGLKWRDNEFYTGRPVMVTRNDYNLGVFNGDIGICHPVADSDQYQVTFPSGLNYLASRLPEHETCFAMTIHKSQGSEFNHVIVLLADETSADASELVTRELLYTAITRSRSRLTFHCSQTTLAGGVKRSAGRVSGMTGFLGIG